MNNSGVSNLPGSDSSTGKGTGTGTGTCTGRSKLTTSELLQLSNLAAMHESLVAIQKYLNHQKEEILLNAGTRI